MLTDLTFCESVQEWFKSYWTYNENAPVSPATLWDSAKATIRGHIIAYTSAWSNKTQELEQEVKRLECLHFTAPNQSNWAQLDDIKKLLFLSKQKYYEYANKSNRLFAHQIKKRKQTREH